MMLCPIILIVIIILIIIIVIIIVPVPVGVGAPFRWLLVLRSCGVASLVAWAGGRSATV
jgi:hypothetical protein